MAQWLWCGLVCAGLMCLAMADPAPPPWPKRSSIQEGDNDLPNNHHIGPNICMSRTNRTQCCAGWTTKPRTSLCVVPLCSRNCGGPGQCIRPNVCRCEGGHEGPSCNQHNINMQNRNRGGCKRICMNGGSCVNATCTCPPGWTGEFCTDPICTEPCLHGGRCIAPDRCVCYNGLSGKRCEIDRRTGPCYTDIRGSLCTNQLDGVVCTKNLCCATVGKAWGHPCEQCADHLDCEIGFLRNLSSGECLDIDECAAIPGLCFGGKCINSIGSFACECPPGQTRNLNTNNCEDKNECEDENICKNGKCVNTEGSYYCLCNPHFIQSPDKKFCVDGRLGTCFTHRSKDGECSDSLPMRLSNRDCCCGKNMGRGWGDYCDACPLPGDPDHSILCIWSSMGSGGKKVVGGGTNTKSGPEGNRPGIHHNGGGTIGGGGNIWHSNGNGFDTDTNTYNPTEPPIEAYKVNECLFRKDICGFGRCIDAEDGYDCECSKGAELDDIDGRPVCLDIDECAKGYCQGGQCKNLPDSFECICPSGFDVSNDGKRCTDMDECALSGMCANGKCINMNGSFKCQCKNGFKLSSTGRACIDIDECYENPRICLNGRCENTPGNYKCHCINGFIESEDGAFCVDIDECLNSGMCDHGKCVNIEGSFQCVCDSGYRIGPDRKHCIDNDECLSSPCQSGKCVNSQGSFKCECTQGFNLGPDGRSCLDNRRDLCYSQYKDGQCLNPTETAVTKSSCCCCTVITGQPMGWGTSCQACPTPGTHEFNQLCPHGPGLTYNGNDINECTQNPDACKNGACENLIGAHRCICNPGYQVDATGKICTDINECEMEESLCAGGQCRNTPGSFQCICPSGTIHDTDLQTCEDVDECEDDTLDAACINGQCVNTHGSYECDCEPGFVLDNTGRVCLDNRKSSCWTRLIHGKCESSLPRLVLRQECCCTVGLAWGSPCKACDLSICDCPKGFAKLDGKACSDINECSLNPDICRGGGTCINTEGSYTCSCPPGLTLDSTGSRCQDMRREACYTDHKHGQCTHSVEGVFSKGICCCSPVGKAWGGDKCEACPRPGSTSFAELCPKGEGFIERIDINECTEFPGICQNGRCKNSVGSYSCRCNKGYELDENKLKCIDINECEIVHEVCGNGTCRNTEGSFQCDCHDGYTSNNMMKVCMDINECTDTPGLCHGGRCVNTQGSFKCNCPAGHELAPDQKSCKDIDECSRTSGICSNGVCENMMGTYQCVCDDGYTQTDFKSHCKDIDECEESHTNCDGECINTPGSYSCACLPGFALQLDGRTCVDINECIDSPRICGGGRCINRQGGHACQCGEGLISNVDSTTCLDVDECSTKVDICGNGDCSNTVGSFVCRCEDGYSVKPEEGPECSDDDECFLGTHNCDQFADCINLPGSFQCRCKDGFTGNGVNCLDINECLTNNAGCHPDAQCINNDGSFKCACDTGFKGNGYSCVDIDECSNDPNLCENGHCLNSPGAFSCDCEMGFMHPNEKNYQSCVDINECQMFNNLCVYGRCENVFGMFKCQCNDGYKIDESGGNCTDIDECQSPQSCLYGTCVNTQGGYKCECPLDYELVSEGNACVDRRNSLCYLDHVFDRRTGRIRCQHPLSDDVTRASCCCSIGKAWGPRCQECPQPDTDEYRVLCPGGPGYKPNVNTVVLEDINECEEHPNMCLNGHCTNTFGSFMCSCNEGYRLDDSGTQCLDINECEENYDLCGAGVCHNEEGKYVCICPTGYMALPSGKECIDMRKEQCYLNYAQGLCTAPMSHEQTQMLCCCSMGKAWGNPCTPCPHSASHEYTILCGNKPGQIINPMTNQTEEIDECALMGSMCKHGTCVDTPGSFECHCNRGYIYDIESHQCRDDNECLRIPNPCRGNAQCINLPGYFECRCPDGYTLGSSFTDCVDMDECADQPGVCLNGDCRNLQGSFQCICKPGYFLTPQKDNCLDLNECQRHQNVCKNGTCVNTPGSYKCNCHDGFKLSPNNDCSDVDECRVMPFLCRNGRCRNTVGAFYCECATGYVIAEDGQHCRDIDECKEIPGVCPSPGRCQNTMGSFSCSCPPGFVLDPILKQCIDIDECSERTGVCEDGVCTNVDGGFTCTCPDGWITSRDGMNCIDQRRDYCYDELDRRHCKNPRTKSLTARECCCSKGVAWGRYCQQCPRQESKEFEKLCPGGIGHVNVGEDLNECAVNPEVCRGGGSCVNTDGSFRCECPQGFVLDSTGTNCIDDNECISNRNVCGNGTCSNVEGSFECQCSTGYAPGPLQTCEDVNECRELGNHCAFRCHNVPGSFRCTCPYGYALAPDGIHCQDVNECQTPANNCKYQCKNLVGSFMCICPEGFTQVGITDECRDVDECLMDAELCPDGTCVNTEGSFICKCGPGFEPSYDGKSCIDRRLGICFRHLSAGRCVVPSLSHHTQAPTTRAACCCSMGEAWGQHCERCPQPDSTQYRQMCLSQGLTIDGSDIDECHMMSELCMNGRCINQMGSYRCSCNRGFKVDSSGTHCLDINECAQRPSPCKFSCQNTEGSYLCSCPTGYSLNADGISCTDIDECALNTHTCHQECINTEGSYECSCKIGYKQHGDTCIDVNECAAETGLCTNPGKCVNTLGSFKCVCPRGYKVDSTGTFCTDHDECLDDTKCDSNCLNLIGGYRCGCQEGYVPHPTQKICIDDNECASNPCEGLGHCFNVQGTYRCGCPDRYQFDTANQVCMPAMSGCTGSPCFFGCTAMGSGGFSCGCPQGYHAVGQGYHCLSTIDGGYGNDDIGNVPTYPIIENQNRRGDSKIISTEGCFSCKINGRHRRDSKHIHHKNVTSPAEVSDDIMSLLEDDKRTSLNDTETSQKYPPYIERALRKRGIAKEHEAKEGEHVEGKGRKRGGKKAQNGKSGRKNGGKKKTRNVNSENVNVTVDVSQTKHRSEIIKIRPSVKNNEIVYRITKGNETKKFGLIKKHGVWALHFRRRLKAPGSFQLEVEGKVPKGHQINATYEKPLKLFVNIEVSQMPTPS